MINLFLKDAIRNLRRNSTNSISNIVATEEQVRGIQIDISKLLECKMQGVID